MLYLDVADHIIPGYKGLSEKQRTLFENSEPGQQMSQFINDHIEMSKNFTKSQGWLSILFGSSEKEREQIKEKFALDKEKLLNTLNKTLEYQTVIEQIISDCLKKECEEFNLLDAEEQKKLATIDCSKTLHQSLDELNKLIELETQEYAQLDDWSKMNQGYKWQNRINTLEIKKKNAVLEWYENKELEPFKKSIAEKKIAQQHQLLEEHLKQLAGFFPLLQRRQSSEESTIIEQLPAKYLPNNEKNAQLDEEHLSNILLNLMHEANQVEMDFINLDGFNKKQTDRIAQKILKAFNKQTDLQIEKWIEKYSTRLYAHLIRELRLINGKEWQVAKESTPQVFMSSLSYLWNNPATERFNAYIAKLGDAHAFIQATNFSTQNESSLLGVLDLYNYARYNEQISETKSIITNLLNPLQPLYDEYKQIAFFEQNPYMKTFRILMPIVISVGVVVLTSAALAPLALPEIAFIAVFIPSLIFGVALATKYVSVKNEVYKYLRDFYYGGSFEIPEFQVNDRMTTAFGDGNAAQVRQFYIDAIKQCDSLELNFRSLNTVGKLTQDKIKERNENLIKRHQLYLEWYDVHSNYELGVDKLTAITLTRLQKECDSEYQLLETELLKEQQGIKESVADVCTDIKNTILNNNVAPGPEEQTNIIKTSYRYGLFKSPNTLSIKRRLEEMDTLNNELQLRPIMH